MLKNNQKAFTLIELIVVMAIFLFIIGATLGIFISIIQQQKKVLAEQQFLNQISYIEEYMSKALRMATVDATGECLGYDNRGYIYLLTRYNGSLGSDGLFRGIKFLSQSDNNACQEFFLDGDGTLNNPFALKELKTYPPLYPPVLDDKAVALTSTDLQFYSESPVKFSINGSDGSALVPVFDQGIWVSCTGTDVCGASNLDYIQPKVSILLNVIIPGDNQGIKTACKSDMKCPVNQACDLSNNLCAPIRTIQTTVSQRNLNVNNGQR